MGNAIICVRMALGVLVSVAGLLLWAWMAWRHGDGVGGAAMAVGCCLVGWLLTPDQGQVIKLIEALNRETMQGE